MQPDRYTIASATGVDVTLDVAGIGGRSYAFIIDWHVRLVLALAWWTITTLALRGTLSFRIGTPHSGLAYALISVLPALVIYFLYHPILEIAMSGRTPGKRMAGVRVVTRLGGTPGFGALAIRNVFRLIDSMPGFYMLGLVTCLFTAERVRFGDLAAGTLLVFDQGAGTDAFLRVAAAVQSGGLDPAAGEVINELLGRWRELSESNRTALAISILQRYERADGSVDYAALDSTALRARLQGLLGVAGT